MAAEGTSSRTKRVDQIGPPTSGVGVLATGNSNSELVFGRHITPLRLIFTITTLLTVTKPVISIYRRPTPGSATNQVKIGTFTFADFAPAGSVRYMNIGSLQPAASIQVDGSTLNQSPASADPTEILPGQSLFMNVDTAASAGAAYAHLEYLDDSDLFKADANVAEVASA